VKRILFVDDDPTLLAGLQNVLHKDRRRWEMTFALGGAEAIDKLAASNFDCVVTDLRMPIVDGAAVLDVVRSKHPETRCVVLSGSDSESVAGAVDGILVKPCSAATLRMTLDKLLR
jgi:CheY-like chemotaxis protein